MNENKTNKPPFEEVWSKISDYAGEKFKTITDLEFTYKIDQEGLYPSRMTYKITKKDFEKAYKLVPIARPGVINDLVKGPAYVWAVLHDPRISPVKC